MGRIRRGWELTKKSWSVLREHRELIRFPIYGAVATIPLAVITLGPGLYLLEEGEIAPGVPLTLISIYILALVGIFFSVGLAAAADRIFRGEEVSVGEGMAVARERLGKVASWALFSTAFGVLISLLEEQGVFGAIIGRLLDIGWALITFLAVPVIAIEGTGPLETLKRSSALFRSRWGQQVTGNIAIGGAVFVLGVLPAAALIGLGLLLWGTSGFGGAVLVVIGVMVGAVALVIQKALSGIFGVALYHYAAEGSALGGFSESELESAVGTTGPGPAPATV